LFKLEVVRVQGKQAIREFGDDNDNEEIHGFSGYENYYHTNTDVDTFVGKFAVFMKKRVCTISHRPAGTPIKQPRQISNRPLISRHPHS